MLLTYLKAMLTNLYVSAMIYFELQNINFEKPFIFVTLTRWQDIKISKPIPFDNTHNTHYSYNVLTSKY